jgi:hypothetical protein
MDAPAKTPDQRMADLQTKVANRGIGGKITQWLRNTVGILRTENTTTANFRAAIRDKVGSDKGAAAIFRELGLKPHKALTERQAALGIQLAGRLEQARGTPLFQTWGEDKFLSGLSATWGSLKANGIPLTDPRVQVLGDHEMIALNEYTEQSFWAFNGDLRGGNPSLDNLAQRDAMISGLAKLPDFHGQCHRGVSLPKDSDNLHRVNMTVSDLAFTSTSSSTDEAFAGTHQMVIESSHGKDISFLSSRPNEKEVLFPPGTQFRVLAREGAVGYMTSDTKPDYGGLNLVMREI